MKENEELLVKVGFQRRVHEKQNVIKTEILRLLYVYNTYKYICGRVPRCVMLTSQRFDCCWPFHLSTPTPIADIRIWFVLCLYMLCDCPSWIRNRSESSISKGTTFLDLGISAVFDHYRPITLNHAVPFWFGQFHYVSFVNCFSQSFRELLDNR